MGVGEGAGVVVERPGVGDGLGLAAGRGVAVGSGVSTGGVGAGLVGVGAATVVWVATAVAEGVSDAADPPQAAASKASASSAPVRTVYPRITRTTIFIS